jgi:hypothetical protein
LPEHPPGCIGYGEGQTRVAYHVGRSQIFNGDSLIVLDVLVGGFMECVFALVGNALMNTSNELSGFLAAVASLLTLRQFPLCSCQFLGTLFRVLGIIDGMPIAISNQITNPISRPTALSFLGRG